MKIMSRIFANAIGCVAASFLLLSCTGNGHDIASNPDRISDAVDINLPAYTVTWQDNNLERDASCWGYYGYHICFNKADVAAMEKKMLEECGKGGHWYRQGDVISYLSEADDNTIAPRFQSGSDLSVSFRHRLGTDSAEVSYEIQEL